MKKNLMLFLVIMVVVSCKDEPKKEMAASSAKFDTLLDRYYEEGLRLNPINATSQGDARFNDQFPDLLSPEYKERSKAYYIKYKDSVQAIDETSLSESQKMTKEILLWECDINLEGMKFKKDLMPIDQMWSINLMMGQYASGGSAQPFKTVEDYRNWGKRVDGFLIWLNSAEKNMREGMRGGYLLPKSLIEKVIPQLAAMTRSELESHLFYTPVKNFPAGFSNEDQEQLTLEYTTMVQDKIIPAYRKLMDFMQKEYLPAGRESSGYGDLPMGKEYYDYAIKLYTTTTMSADSIHELGLSEVERIKTEMEKVKVEVGFTGDLKAFFEFVRTDEALMPYTTPEAVVGHFNEIHERMQPQVDKLFSLQPKTAFEVRRTEAFREASASAEYNPGSLDGTRPGIFYVPVPNAKAYNVYADESLFLHEAIPGHHFQISLTQESGILPEFRKTLWYSAYGEGWALYCESLGKEMGLYTDPFQYFGMLGAEMHRAVRLVVDTGLHTKGWSREKAIAYCMENEAMSEEGITAEIERYMANPGQALSYKIGQLKLLELRAKAKQKMGNKFDIREYHKEVLETGCIPLELLDKKINTWIERGE